MPKKSTIILSLILIAVVVLGYLATKDFLPVSQNAGSVQEENAEVSQDGEAAPEGPGKLKVINTEGTLQEVNHGCAYDAECYVVVDGKHITTMKGWSREIGGRADLDVLDTNIGKTVEVYAQDKGDGTYTLYGSEGFYVRPKK